MVAETPATAGCCTENVTTEKNFAVGEVFCVYCVWATLYEVGKVSVYCKL